MLGRREWVFFPDWNIGPMEAKVDTGAYTGALHADDICESISGENIPMLSFVFKKEYYPFLPHDITLTSFDFSRKPIRNSFGEEEIRYLIPVRIRIGKKIIRTRISLTNRCTMKYPLLIGRRVIKNKFWLDVSALHLNGKKFRLC